ncbi:MAG: M56 family metallopeptidase [Muribaculaceae bacterium]|nr:M56 family metallopeptidase [Muribaculaceae bacterium]
MILSYSLISSVLLLCGFAVYCLAMADQRQFGCNRAALIGVCLSALFIPALLLFMPAAGVSTSSGGITIGELEGGNIVDSTSALAMTAIPVTIVRIATGIYLAGVLAMALYTAWSLLCLWRLVRAMEKIEHRGFNVAVADGLGLAPFSWLKTVVMSRDDYENNGAMILEHELEHLRRRHWADILLAQVVLCLQWYNPAAWALRTRMRAVHEYQADEAVLAAGYDPTRYQHLLIEKAVGTRSHSLANSLNHSKLKKRLTMMYKKQSSPARRLCALLLVPALAAGCALTSVPAVAHVISSISTAEAAEQLFDGKVTKKIAENTSEATPKSEIVDEPEQMAEPEGGQSGLMFFLSQNVKYPEEAVKAGEEGKVVVSFVIGEDGSISDAEIKTSVSPSLDAEALRVVGLMPAWTPARSGGKAVATHYALPITFKLPKK